MCGLSENSQTAQVTAEIENTMTEAGALGGGADARLDQIVSIVDGDSGDAMPLLETTQNNVRSDAAADLSLIDATQADGVNVADANSDGVDMPLCTHQ